MCIRRIMCVPNYYHHVWVRFPALTFLTLLLKVEHYMDDI